MKIIKITGGLGNQMFQYAIAKSIVNKTKDKFFLDISFYPQQTLRNYELNFFNIEENIASDKECTKFKGKKNFFSKVFIKFGLEIRPKSYYKEKELGVFDKTIFTLQNDIYLDGYWQNEYYFKNIRDEILEDFTLKQDISNEAKKYLEKIKYNNSVSLHIRRGDYIVDNITNMNHGICDILYYKNAINYILDKVNNCTFFIFSDDIQWCKEHFGFLDNKIFVDTTKNALEDLELMKNCKHNIVANSTFSWWGAWLNGSKEKIVIAPKIWFIKEEWKDVNIACRDWIKL